MTRSNIERNRRIHQVRTVVWEDGAVRPLLPDPHGITQNVVQAFSTAQVLGDEENELTHGRRLRRAPWSR